MSDATTFLIGVLTGLYLGLCMGIVTSTLGFWHRRGRHVMVGRRDLGNGPFAYGLAFTVLTWFFPLAFVHDLVFERQWITWTDADVEIAAEVKQSSEQSANKPASAATNQTQASKRSTS